MVRPLRIDVPGGIAHLTARGNNRAAVFPAAEHRDRLVSLLSRDLHRAILNAIPFYERAQRGNPKVNVLISPIGHNNR